MKLSKGDRQHNDDAEQPVPLSPIGIAIGLAKPVSAACAMASAKYVDTSPYKKGGYSPTE